MVLFAGELFWVSAMKFIISVALSIILASYSFAFAADSDSKSSKDYISKLRIGGWIGNDALLVLPDRSAGAAPIGQGFGGVKLIEVGNTSFTADYGGTQGKVTLDPGWQLAPHPDLTNWIIAFMKSVGQKIDAQTPDVSQQGVVRIMHNGASTSNFMKVIQAGPFQSLPDWMEYIDVRVSINPHEPTKLQFVSMGITPDAHKRLLK